MRPEQKVLLECLPLEPIVLLFCRRWHCYQFAETLMVDFNI